LKRMCEMAGIRTIISATPYLKRIGDPGLPQRMLLIEQLLPAIPKLAVIWHLALTLLLPPRWRDQGRPHDVACLVFSSGSTGDPKGVQLTHAQILANCDGIRKALDVGPGDVVLTPLPLFHSFGLVPGMWLGLECGFAIAAHPDPTDAKGLGELAAKTGATFAITTATFVRGWMRRIPAESFATLRFAAAGAEKCPKELRDAFKAKYGGDLLEGYGCTELAPLVSVNLQAVTRRGETEVRTRDCTVGRAIPGVHVIATHLETRAPLPTGQEGLLIVRSPARMQGYLGRDDLTAKVFMQGGYDTGDVGIVDAEGFIRITGRLARFAKIGGEMVPLDTVEAAIQAPHAEHCEIAVAAVPDPDRGERLIVLVAGETQPSSDEVVAGAAQLAPLWRPKAKDVHRVDALPRLGTGKRDLAGVKRLAADKAGV
jgi:acyl-[acyl-carrier-protein]-phospholipid O-acyltransferase / long-chain-fatty-acid--[acyl-carrier-protein] ligase